MRHYRNRRNPAVSPILWVAAIFLLGPAAISAVALILAFVCGQLRFLFDFGGRP